MEKSHFSVLGEHILGCLKSPASVKLPKNTTLAFLFVPLCLKFSHLKGNSGIFKPRPYFWHEIRSATHREQFGESRHPSEDILDS